jgi:hypothetical protein
MSAVEVPAQPIDATQAKPMKISPKYGSARIENVDQGRVTFSSLLTRSEDRADQLTQRLNSAVCH